MVEAKTVVSEEPAPLPLEEPQKAAAPPPEPEAAKEEDKLFWNCTVPKDEGAKWGFSFAWGRSYLRVTDLNDAGSFATYNSKAPEAQKVLPELCITRVNDVENGQGMKAILMNPEVKEVSLRVCRPRAFQVVLKRDAADPWGIDLLTAGSADMGLVIKTIKPGGIFDVYNSKADTPEESKLQELDIVTSAGTLRKGKEIIEHMKNPATKMLELTLLRLPVDDGA